LTTATGAIAVASIVPKPRRFIVNGYLNGIQCKVLLDSGASACVSSTKLIKKFEHERFSLIGPDGKSLGALGTTYTTLELNGLKKRLRFYVLENISADYDAIIGVNGLKSFRIMLDFMNDCVIYGTEQQTKVPDHISPIDIDNATRSSALNEEQKRELRELLAEFKDVFDTIQPGSAKGVTHEIEVEEGTKPIYRKPYTMPFSKKEIVRDEVSKMLEEGVIRPSKSPWSSPVVLVTKKDGGHRFCVDYTALNKVTKKDQHPLPKIDEILREVKGAKYFSTLDLQSGYWQIRMNEQDVEKTAFTTDEGHYEFLVLPFGVCNGPATFQRYMREVLAYIKNVRNIIDDILVFTDEWKKHLSTLRMVLQAIREADLRCKIKKCKFAVPEVHWVGHILEPGGIRVDPSKTTAIEDYTQPKNVKELRSFLGMANYYRKFVKNFAIIAAPLYDLTKKGIRWKWEEQHERGFQDLKRALTSTPVLVNPDFSKPYRLYTDASGTGMGAVLCQVQEGSEEKVIAYASQHLNHREKNFSTIEREALAMVWALKKFHVYLYGSVFKIMSDHAPLKWLANKKHATGRLARWQYTLMEYTGLEGIDHIKGKENIVADTLSRMPELFTSTTDKEDADASILSIDPCLDETAFKSEQEKDPYYKSKHNMRLEDGVWKTNERKIFVPHILREKAIKNFHGRGVHFGVSKTYQLMSHSLFWPSMQADLQEFIKSCDICTVTKTPLPSPAPNQSLPEVKRPMQRIALDYCGPFPLSNSGNKYLLVTIDHFSRYLRVFPVPEATTSVSVKCLERIILDEGVPSEILTDRGTHFTGEILQNFLRNKGIKHLLTSPGRPQCDGMAERQMRTLKNFIRADVLERTDVSSKTWDLNVEKIVSKLNKTIHPATGHSPFEIARGRTPTEVCFPWMTSRQEVQQMKNDWTNVAERNTLVLSKGRSRANENRVLRELKVGEKVWRRVPQPGPLRPKYNGPYEILNRVGEVNYRIGNGRGLPNAVVHVDYLLPAKTTRSGRLELYPAPRGRPRKGGE
jgi:transposase InsO family protein